MKNLLKISALAIIVSIAVAGCSGCGDRTNAGTGKIDTGKTAVDSSRKAIDTAKTDTAKKDTAKKK
ncbi:MAG: hypothetical protein JST19_05785 [Bacteroidetes bacterium]|nr:hypothetical protein [Bacteroidota bacterium]